MERDLTKLETGIFVKIDPIQLALLEQKKGYLSKEFYPEKYGEICVDGEVGRFLIFRIIEDK